jgi:glycosyltransferase involved in cell wall biosynthesis
VIPLNHTNAEYFKSLGLRNVEVVPLGFSDTFRREQKPVSKGPVRVFTASVLIRLKNIHTVIRAVSQLVEKYDITYTIIGKGEERENLEQLVKELGLEERIQFVDHIPHQEIADVMHTFDIFIMPSYFETFGRVYFECMAMGIPIICARQSGIHGIFREKEEGLAVDHTSVESIAGALEYLVTRPEERRRIGLNGQKLVSPYTWEYVARDLRSRYEVSISKAG